MVQWEGPSRDMGTVEDICSVSCQGLQHSSSGAYKNSVIKTNEVFHNIKISAKMHAKKKVKFSNKDKICGQSWNR